MALTDISVISRTWVIEGPAKKGERNDIDKDLTPNAASEKNVETGAQEGAEVLQQRKGAW